MSENYLEQLELAKKAALEAGKILMDFYKNENLEIRYKEDTDFNLKEIVTQADDLSNNKIEQILNSKFPNYGWLSEETIDNPLRLAKEFVWIIDPLDGTKEYAKGIPTFVVSIGLARDGVPVVGVIYSPATKELFYASKANGAYLNDKQIFVTKTKQINQMKLLVSASEYKQQYLKDVVDKLDIREVEAIGSTALKAVKIACGYADAYFTFTKDKRRTKKWDIAGSHLIIEQAGGIITDLNNESFTYNKKDFINHNGILVTNGQKHKEICDLINKSKSP